MRSGWVSRTYTYSEPSDREPESDPIDGTDSLTRSPGNRPDFDAGYSDGYRAGWVAGYAKARAKYDHDLAVEGAGESPSLLL